MDYGVYAADPPNGCAAVWGGERQNDLPYAEQVQYVRDGALLLSIRTVQPEPDPPPVIGSVEDFGVMLGGFRRYGARRLSSQEVRARFAALLQEDAQTPALPTSILLDGLEVAGRRKDFGDCSVALFEPGGLRVFCAADPGLLDGLALRSRVGRV